MQLFTQGVVVTPALWMQEGDCVSRTLNDDTIVMLQSGQGLHIKIHADVTSPHDLDFNYAGVCNDDGPI